MAPRRFAGLAVSLCGAVALAGWLITGVAGFGLPNIKNTDAAPIEDRREPLRSVDNELVDASQAAAIIKTGVPNADAGPAGATVTGAGESGKAEAIVEAALTEPSETPSSETPPVQIATAGTPDLVHTEPKEAVTTIETTVECLTEVCIDQYLWSVYQRTPKLDTVKEVEQRRVIVKRNGKQRTVIKELTKLVDEDFTWKDPKAAEKAGMSLMDYVIGGMDRGFKLKLYHALRALDDAGLSPGITSAFRDDYRQSLASGLKAATDRSYHGGSFRGGYGHGLRLILSASRARHVPSDRFQVRICGNGLTRTARSLELGDHILIKTQPMWHRSTAKNMPITAAGRIRNTHDRKSRSATCSLFAMIKALRNSQEPQDRRIFEKHLTRIRTYSKTLADGYRWQL